MKRWSSRHQLRLITEISVTPLLDLVFVLLFVFMLAAPLMRNDTMLLPASRAADEPGAEPADVARLCMDAQRFVTLESEPVVEGSLPAALAGLRSRRPEVAVRVEMHRDLPVQVLVDIMDDLREAGIQRTAVVTSRVITR
jgi:biopolymer transport protein ExbD